MRLSVQLVKTYDEMIEFKERITLDAVEKVLYSGEPMKVDPRWIDKVDDCFRFLEKFATEKVIYGINTGFGPMAQWRVDDKYLTDLQYNIIRSHSTGAGDPLDDVYVKSAMIARLGTVLQCRSGVHTDVVRILVEFINHEIFPFIPMHGSVGASGDLVQLAHIALCLIGEGEVHYKGQWRPTAEVMKENGIEPLKIHIREGLSITNGTSVMTGISIVNQFHAENLLDWATLAAVWMNEIAASFDDYMSEGENNCRRHEGQQVMARRMRELSEGSQCLKKRAHELYDYGHSDVKVFEHKVQAYYSLRCTPQILGPIYDTLKNTRQILEDELNSACDNPIIDPETEYVYHGGNFHGDYISLEEDKVKIALVRLCMTAERFPRSHQRHFAALPQPRHTRTELRDAGLPVHGHLDDRRVPNLGHAQLRAQHPEQQRQPRHRQHGHQLGLALQASGGKLLPGDGHPIHRLGAGHRLPEDCRQVGIRFAQNL